MDITVFGKAGCGLCDSFKAKLDLLELPYNAKTLGEFVEFHKGWRDDDSVNLMAFYLHNGKKMPIIRVDGEYFMGPQAMKTIKAKMAATVAV